MKIIILNLTVCTALGLTGVANAKNDETNSQAGGLPAVQAELAELRALVESLQDQVGGSADPYVGSYAVSLVETSYFGCGSGNDPLANGPLIPYLQVQGISSAATRTAYFTAESNGNVMSIPAYPLSTQELRLSGTLETDTRDEGEINIMVGTDGSLNFDPGPKSVFSGQISDDGSTFSILVSGLFEEEGCGDAYTVLLTGVRK